MREELGKQKIDNRKWKMVLDKLGMGGARKWKTVNGNWITDDGEN
jgi:hypothetical protein